MSKTLVHRMSFWSIAATAACWSIASHALIVSVDDFSVVRNGNLFFQDSFSDGVAPPNGPNGDATYFIVGSNPTETDGMVLLNSADGASTANSIGQSRIEQRVLLRTNIDPNNLDAGLKSNDTFALTGIFSLTTPSGVLNPQYSVRFNDTSGEGAHQVIQLQVLLNSASSQSQVRYILQDFDTNTLTVLGTSPFAPPEGADRVVLNITRPDAASDNAFASFGYLAGGVSIGDVTSFETPALLFQGENFVRAEFNVSDGVAPIPEPSTYALMLAGLATVGWAARRRRS